MDRSPRLLPPPDGNSDRHAALRTGRAGSQRRDPGRRRPNSLLRKGTEGACHTADQNSGSALKQWLDEPRPGSSDILFPTVHGSRMSPDAVRYLLAKYVKKAAQQCTSLRAKRVSPHVLRHSAAMELLDAGVDSTVISLWLGHESTRSTRAYLHAHLAIKEAALAKVAPLNAQPFRRFKAGDKLLSFLENL